MQSTGQTFSHCLQPMQSSILTWSRMRERSLRSPSGTICDFHRASGFSSARYCWVTLGMKRWRSVTPMPMAMVVIETQIPSRYSFISRPSACLNAQPGDGHQHRERNRDQVLPAECQELIHPAARERPPEPHLHEHQEKRLEEKNQRPGKKRTNPAEIGRASGRGREEISG